MLPTTNRYGGWCSSGEIDIMEHVNGATKPVYSTLHYGGIYLGGSGANCVQDGSNKAVSPLASGTSSDWHTYAVVWSPDYMAFQVGISRHSVL